MFEVLSEAAQTPADTLSGLQAKASVVRAYRRMGAETGASSGEDWSTTFNVRHVPDIAGEVIDQLAQGAA